MNDLEITNAAERLDDLYEHEGYPKRSKRDTFLDPLGQFAWAGTYTRLRDTLDHETAIRQIEAQIREIWRRDKIRDGVIPGEPTPAHPGPLKGRLRYAVGGLWEDDDGPVVPLFCHFMEAFSAWCHGKQAQVTAQCARIAAAGYHGIRVLDVLGFYDVGGSASPTGWRGKEVTPIAFRSISNKPVPATAGFYGQKRAFLEMLHGLGLKVMDDRGDLNAWSASQKLEHMRRNGELYASLPFGREILAGLWTANEGVQNGMETPDLGVSMLRAFEQGAGWLPDSRGLTWWPEDEGAEGAGELPSDLIYWSPDPATVCTMHGTRTASREHIIGHYLGYGYYDGDLARRGKRTWNTEPVGGGSGVSVGQVNDVELLCGIASEAVMTGQAWTHMSGHGVFWAGPVDDHPGFREIPRLLKYLPKDMHAFDTIGHAGTRFRGTRILAAIDNPPTRADYAIHRDGRFVMNVYGAGAPLPFERACAECRVIDVVNDRVQSDGPRRIGDRFTDSYQHCRLVTGRLA